MSSGTKFLFSTFLLILFTWLIFRFLLPFALPFLLGTALAFTAEPLVRRLSGRLRLPRGLCAGISVTLSFFLLSSLVLGLFSLLIMGLKALGGILPDLETAAVSGIQLLEQWLLSLASRSPGTLRKLLTEQVLAFFSDGTAFLQKGIQYILGLAGGALTHIPGQALTLFTALISGFMISARLPVLKAWCKEKLSLHWISSLLAFLKKIRKALGHWVLAQLKLAGVTLLILTLGLILLKIPYAPIWALAITLLDALPLLGTGAILLPWGLISFLQENRVQGLGLLALYTAVSLTRSLLEPRFVGKQLGLDPLLTLCALYAGYRLWGFGGMILSPLLAVTLVSLFGGAGKEKKSS